MNIGNLHWPSYGYELVKIKNEFAKVGIEIQYKIFIDNEINRQCTIIA
jgi:hypothetical protein